MPYPTPAAVHWISELPRAWHFGSIETPRDTGGHVVGAHPAPHVTAGLQSLLRLLNSLMQVIGTKPIQHDGRIQLRLNYLKLPLPTGLCERQVV